MLGLILVLAVTGCGAQDKDASQTTEQTASVIAESSESVAEPVKEPDYALGEKFTVHNGDSFDVGGLYEVSVDTIYSGYGAVYAQITVKTADGEYSHSVWRTEEGYTKMTNMPLEVPPYVIEMPRSVEGEADLIFTKRVYPEPVTLSGNPEDVYTFDDYAYTVGDKIVMYFDKDITVQGDALVLAEKVYDELEAQTGLTFKNDTVYSALPSYDWAESYLGFDPWNGYDYYHYDRLGIYCIHDRNNETWVSCAQGNVLILIDEDFDFHTESLYSVGHEMAHCLQLANSDCFGQVLTEGFGSYWGCHIGAAFPEYISEDKVSWGPTNEFYWSTPEQITAQNAEALFNAEFDRMENCSYYEYGFQLMTYLYENFSTEEINAFYTALSEKIWEYRFEVDEYAEMSLSFGMLGQVSDQEFETVFIKEYWGEDFFEKFGTWAKKNAKRFSW